MKVLVFTSVFPNCRDGNRGIYVYKQVKELKSICSVDVVVPVPFYANISFLKDAKIKIERIGIIGEVQVQYPIYYYIPGMFRLFNGIFMFLSVLWYLKLHMKDVKWDVVIGHFAYPDAFASILLGKLFRLPVCVFCHGSDINFLTKKRIARKLVAWTLRKAGRIFSVSEALKNRMIDIGIESKKIVVIKNGIETSKFIIMRKSERRDRLGIHKDNKVLVYVGRLSHEKGVDVLINAFSLLKNHNLQLFLAGGGPEDKPLRELAFMLGVDKRVIFLGPKPNSEIPGIINAADLFILPSRSEGYPNVLLESLACGVPVLATHVGGIPEIITSEQLGLIVPPDDPSRMAEGIEDALGRIWNREYLSEHVRQQTWEANARKLFDEISEIISPSNSQSGGEISC